MAEKKCLHCGDRFSNDGTYPFCKKLACTIAAARMMGVEISIERQQGASE